MAIGVITSQDVCEMTAVPGGIMECADSQAAISILRDFATLDSYSLECMKKVPSLASPIQIEGLNRSVQLTYRPLSYEYQPQIMSFTSAHAPLLQFLKKDAFKHEEIGNTCSTLFFDESSNELMGFCATKCSSLKIKGSKIISLCPTVEIAALCVDDKYRYMGIGQAIFNHAIQQIYQLRTWVGVQLITLFAVPEAVTFYQKFNFRTLLEGMKVFYTQSHESCIPMYFPLPPIKIDKR